MTVFTWIFFGAIVGWLATRFAHTSKKGFFSNMVLGIIGSIAGGYIMTYFDKPGITGFNLYSIFVGVLGAVALIIIGRLFKE